MTDYNALYRDVVCEAPPGPVLDMFSKAWDVIRRYDRPMVAVSGGSDSDILVDLFTKLDPDGKVTYVYFNTGMEYDATKRHLKDLEQKYGIKIEWIDPDLPIPTCCRRYGVPFWSKRVSEYIYRLQKHNFQWEDEPFEVLYARYPRCKAALRWWCNEWPNLANGGVSAFNIGYTPWLKEFMVENPPPMPISAKCCEKAKKAPATKYQDAQDFDLSVNGVRKAEKGARAQAYHTCYTRNTYGVDSFRPLFWLSDEDKLEYKLVYGITNSDCYEVWGMTRTGCPGCPYGKEFEQELVLMQQYEPKFHKAALNIFGASYEYTRAYLQYRAEKTAEKARQEATTS